MSNVTIKDLRNTVALYNDKCQATGLPLKFREQGRNGCQAVDLMSHSGVCLRNIGCGTSKEVSDSVVSTFYSELGYYLKQFKDLKVKFDVNGNKRIHIYNRILDKSFSIQTLGNLPFTHRNVILKQEYYIDIFLEEINQYVDEFGTDRQKLIMGLF